MPRVPRRGHLLASRTIPIRCPGERAYPPARFRKRDLQPYVGLDQLGDLPEALAEGRPGVLSAELGIVLIQAGLFQ